MVVVPIGMALGVEVSIMILEIELWKARACLLEIRIEQDQL